MIHCVIEMIIPDGAMILLTVGMVLPDFRMTHCAGEVTHPVGLRILPDITWIPPGDRQNHLDTGMTSTMTRAESSSKAKWIAHGRHTASRIMACLVDRDLQARYALVDISTQHLP